VAETAPPDRLQLLDRRVAALRKTRPDLADALDLQEAIIHTVLTSARPPRTQPFPLPRDQLVARVREGVPLLHNQPVWLDINYAADLVSRLVDALSQRPEPDVSPLIDAATGGLLDPQQLFTEAFVQHHDHLADLAQGVGVDAELLSAVASQSVAPLLRGYAERLLPLVEQADDGTLRAARWTRGYCPVCGAWPLIGELRGVELSQWLRCSACASGWRAYRLVCPFCANADYHSLGTLTIEGEQRFRVAVCERCKGFLKIANAFDPAPGELLPLDDVASLHLDVAAIERGYLRPPGSGFRLELAIPEMEWVEELA
jgi:FdhE protein